MRALLLPVKDLKDAKKRLAGPLTPEERLGLAQAMLADAIRAIQGVRHAERVVVVTSYLPVMNIAEENGWVILREDRQISESHAVDFGSRVCADRGVTGLLRVPLDVPLMQASDIDELLAIECATPFMAIVPSRDGTGTNALLRTPPTLFPSHFGEGSFAKHVGEAQRLGAQVIFRNNRRLELDVDDEADLRVLLEKDLSGTETGRWLRESGVAARLQQDMQPSASLSAKA
jgi:2-phospho-L-lactate/phosphoenolpyruvate guanylyltransferase